MKDTTYWRRREGTEQEKRGESKSQMNLLDGYDDDDILLLDNGDRDDVCFDDDDILNNSSSHSLLSQEDDDDSYRRDAPSNGLAIATSRIQAPNHHLYQHHHNSNNNSSSIHASAHLIVDPSLTAAILSSMHSPDIQQHPDSSSVPKNFDGVMAFRRCSTQLEPIPESPSVFSYQSESGTSTTTVISASAAGIAASSSSSPINGHHHHYHNSHRHPHHHRSSSRTTTTVASTAATETINDNDHHPSTSSSSSSFCFSHLFYSGPLWKRVAMGAIMGGIGGLCLSLFWILISKLPSHAPTWTAMDNAMPLQQQQQQSPSFWENNPISAIFHKAQSTTASGIQAYLDLFQRPTHQQSKTQQQKRNKNYFTSSKQRQSFLLGKNFATDLLPQTTRIRRTNSDTNDSQQKELPKGPKLVIAGKMSVEEGACNIAQLNLDSNEWSLTERIQLSLYNSYSGGEVYALLANHTSDSPTQQQNSYQQNQQSQRFYYPSSNNKSSKRHINDGSGKLIVVGAFDTTYRNSQVTYCSVGKWDGIMLSKVGEGLCNSALSKGMKITTASLAGPQDVYVAGSFHTQVWNGDRHEFVKIFNLAHFNAIEQVWLPLNVGQITCSWCTVTVLALAWDSTRRQLHVAGKFNAIDGRNVPAGLAIYDLDSGHLVAHPGGGLSMRNSTQDGVGTALQLDEDAGVLYVMGSFERLTATHEICLGLAAYEINANRWTCLADAAHTVLPTGGGNMLLTPFGLMVAGKTTPKTTWPDSSKPYTIALLTATLKKSSSRRSLLPAEEQAKDNSIHDFNWSWLPGFDGHDEPLHALSNGFGAYEGTVFIAGDNLVAKWSYQKQYGDDSVDTGGSPPFAFLANDPNYIPTTENLSEGHVRGAIMAISQMMPEQVEESSFTNTVNYSIIVYCVALGTVIGVVMAILCNRNVSPKVASIFGKEKQLQGFSLDTLTYSAIEHTSITEAYKRAMQTRYVQHPHLLTLIDPQEIFLQRIIGEGTFGRVWSAKWRSAKVAVKEFVFAQAAVAGKSSMQGKIVEEIIGEAGMMAILRHPNVLQLFGCSLTAQAIWIVSELCSLGSLRQLLDDNDRVMPLQLRIHIALQVAEGMTYLHNQDPPIIHRDLKSHNIFVHETFTESDVSAELKELSLRQRAAEQEGNANMSNSNGSSSIMFRFKADTADQRMKTQSTIVAKIGDWGSARATLSGSRTMTHGVGTACWLAPEVIKHARSSKFSDVYSYGIVLWELATREEVYQGLETTQIIAKVANESLRPPVPRDCPWKHIMVRCWEENPNDRMEFTKIVDEFNSVLPLLPTEKEQTSSLSTSKPTSSSSSSLSLLNNTNNSNSKNSSNGSGSGSSKQ